jgi:hypothetical protein
VPATSADFLDAVAFFQRAFTIVLALALGEAFKQFIADKAVNPEDRVIHWDRLPGLLSFLFLAFPFFHGMSRYFFVTYIHAPSVPNFYAAYLMFDGIAFLFESAIFFVMSRALSAGQWKRYYWSVLLLLGVDITWGAVAVHRGIPITPWLVLDSLLAIVLLAVLWAFRDDERSMRPPVICACTVFITTALSYVLMWDFYFP